LGPEVEVDPFGAKLIPCRERCPGDSERERRGRAAHAPGLPGGAYEAALAAFAHDVEVVTSLERFHGHAGMVEEARRWEEMWIDYRFEVSDLVDAGDKVVLLYHQVGKARESGTEVEERAGWVYTLRGRKIVRVEMFQDCESAMRAAGAERRSH
jgi:ketosteroid isomerase-like protein